MRKPIFALAGLALFLCLRGPEGVTAVDAWVVNTTADDVDPGGCQADPGDCTLREAIEEANTTDTDLILFDIPLSDTNCDGTTCTITLTSALPTIGAPGGVTISEGQNNTIGGQAIADRNVISGNGFHGILIVFSGANGNKVYGNYIGTSASGTASLGNVYNGIKIDGGAQSNYVGGVAETKRNVISGNGHGVLIGGTGTDGNVVEGNYIGMDFTGMQALGNSGVGVYVDAGAQDNEIGNNNVIAFNGSDGVRVNGALTTGNTITRNMIYNNGGLGIALTDGGNGSLPAPVIEYADCTSVGGSAGLSQNVEVFSDLNGEGRHFECEGQTKPDGVIFFCVTGGPIFSFPRLTATATDAAGNTSQFSTPSYPSGCSFGYLPVVMREY